MRRPDIVLAIFLALLATSCAMKQDGGPRRSVRVLTAEEIAELPATTAMEAVRRARPQWLRPRSSPTMENPAPAMPVLYMDGVRMGDLSQMETVRAEEVEQMEYLYPSEATNRFGTGHQGGAILVTTR